MWTWSLVAVAALAVERLEFEVDANDDVNIVPAGEHGVVLFLQREGRKQYEIQGYGTDLTPTFNQAVEVDKASAEMASDHDDGHAWVALQRGKNVQAMRTDLATGATQLFPVELARTAYAAEVRADGHGGAWIAGARAKDGVLTWVGPEGQSVVVDLGKKRLVQSLTRGEDGTVQASIRDWRVLPGAPLTVLDLDRGQIVRTREVAPPDEETYLLTGRSLALEGDDFMAGTWSPPSWIQGAQGLYVAGIGDAGQTFFKSWRFEELENFLEWMPDPKEERVEKRVEKRKDRGATTKIRWNLMFHDPIQTPEGVVVTAEAYYPVYYTYTTTTTTSNGQGGTTTVTTTYTVFVGWRFSHALIAGLDREGNKLWDHSVPIQSAVTKTLAPHVRLLPMADGAIQVVWSQGKRLNTASLRGSELTAATELTTEDVGATNTTKNLAGDASWWYGDHFLAWGVDRVKEDGKKEKVFFVSRLDVAAP